MSQPKFIRKKKLIDPRLQLSLVGSFGGVALLAILLQFLILGYALFRAASEIEGSGGELVARLPGILLLVLGISCLVLVPIFLGVGILLTFRIAGPAYRLENYLRSVARGEESEPCRIRKGDKFQSLCDAVNLATEPLRQAKQGERPHEQRKAA